MEVYFNCTLQVNYIPSSTGELVWYLRTFIWRLSQVHAVRYNGLIWLMETCSLAVHQCQSYLWHCLCCIMEYYCSIFNYHLVIILIAFSATCVSIIALVAEIYMIFITPNYDWRKIFDWAVMWHQFVNLENFPDRDQRSHHLQVIISLKLYHVWCETIL